MALQQQLQTLSMQERTHPSYEKICLMWNHQPRRWFERWSEKIMACKKRPVSFEAVVRCYLFAQNIFIFMWIMIQDK